MPIDLDPNIGAGRPEAALELQQRELWRRWQHDVQIGDQPAVEDYQRYSDATDDQGFIKWKTEVLPNLDRNYVKEYGGFELPEPQPVEQPPTDLGPAAPSQDPASPNFPLPGFY